MPRGGSDVIRASVASLGEVRVLRATLNRTSALPSGYSLDGIAERAGGSLERVADAVRSGGRQLSRHAFFLLVNLLVATLVMALPFLAATHPDAQSHFAP